MDPGTDPETERGKQGKAEQVKRDTQFRQQYHKGDNILAYLLKYSQVSCSYQRLGKGLM